MKIRQAFTEHPATVGETYGSHLVHAMSFGSHLVMVGVACIIHALLPFVFVTTGSRAVTRLYERMIVNRASAAPKTGGIATPV